MVINVVAILALLILLGALGLYFYLHRQKLAATELKAVHLVCAVCGRMVARFEQLEDKTIRCVNCKRAAEKKAKE